MRSMLPEYHLIQRKRKNGSVVLYAGILRADGSGRYTKMIQLSTAPAVKGSREKARRDREAHAELLELHAKGLIGTSSGLSEYLTSFWDYERSEYVRSKRAEGRTVTPAYCRNNRTLIETYFLPFMKHHRIETLADLTKPIILQWRNHLYEHRRIVLPAATPKFDKDGNPATISATTVNKVRQAVHVALEHAVTMDLIPSNPMHAVKRVKEEPERREIFERDEIVKLFSLPWPDIRAYAGAMLSASTGLRLGEVRGLLVRNLYLDEGYLNVLTSWSDDEGVKPPKWNDVRYGVPLPGRVADALAAVITVHPYSPGPDSFVFFGDDATRPIGMQVIPREMKRAMSAAGIPARGRTFHCLRHTAASLIAGSAGSERVQRLLGHTTAAMTERYTHPTEGDRAIVLEAQEALWTEPEAEQ